MRSHGLVCPLRALLALVATMWRVAPTRGLTQCTDSVVLPKAGCAPFLRIPPVTQRNLHRTRRTERLEVDSACLEPRNHAAQGPFVRRCRPQELRAYVTGATCAFK